MRSRRDLVFVDQRGTGGSNALTCPFYGPPQDVQSYFGPFLPVEKVRECRDRLARTADLSQYTTSSSVEDLEEVRVALGYQQVNLIGGSYGTRLAMEARDVALIRRLSEGALDRNATAEAGVFGKEDLAHPTGPNLLDDPVVCNTLPDHGWVSHEHRRRSRRTQARGAQSVHGRVGVRRGRVPERARRHLAAPGGRAPHEHEPVGLARASP